MNLEQMDLSELKQLRKDVDRAIASFEDRKKKDALEKLEQAAKELGYSLGELTGVSGAKPRAKVAPKYANPANKAETWTGRGRKPRWVEAALKSGKSLDDLKI